MKSWPKVKLGQIQVGSNIAQNHSFNTYKVNIWSLFALIHMTSWPKTVQVHISRCLFSQILICERLVGLVSFKTNVSETAGQIHLSDNVRCNGGHSHWIDNVRCKMHQTRLQVKWTSRLRLKRKLKSVWK